MATIANLYVQLELQAENFNNAIKGAAKEAKEFEKTIKPSVQAATDLGLAMTATGGAVVAGMLTMVKSSADLGEQLNKVSIQTGISTEELSKLKHAAEQNEASFEELSSGLKKMSSSANNGSDAFKELGVKVIDTNGQLRPMNSILLDVADKFRAMEYGTQKSALAVEIFGRGGIALIPTLNLGRDGIREMGDEATRFGIVVSGDASRAADDFNDNLSKIKDAVQGVSNAVGNALIPSLNDYAVQAQNVIVGVREFASENEGLTKSAFGAATAITGAGGLLLGLAAVGTLVPKIQAGFVLLGTAATEMGLTIAAVPVVGQFAALAYLFEQILETEGDLKRTHEQVAASQTKAVEQTFANIKVLETLGVTIDQTGKSWQQVTAEVNKLMILHRDDLPDSIETTIRKTKEYEEAIKAQQKIETAWRAVQAELYQKHVEDAARFVDAWLKGFQVTSDEADKFTAAIQRSEVAASKLSYSTVDAAAVIATAAASTGDAWEAANEKALGSGATLFNKMEGLRHTDLDDTIVSLQKRIKEEERAVAEQIAIHNRMGDEFASTLVRMTDRLANSFADMVVHGKFSMDSLKSIAQDTAESMLTSFLKGLISPLTDHLAQLGTKLGDIISSALGIGGSVASGGAAAGAAGAAGTAGTAGGGGLGAIGGLLTNPITGIIAGLAAGAIGWVKSQAHWEANDLVQNLQNPFDQKFGQLYNLAATNQDTLSGADMMSAHDAMWSLWQATIDSVQAWAGSSSDRQRVASQFFETEIPVVGPALQEILDLANNRLMQGLATGTPLVTREGPFYLHAGEAVIPADQNPNAGGSGMGGDLYLTVNVASGSRASALEIREQLEQWVDDFNGNVRGIKTAVTAGVKSHWDSVVTA